MDDSGINWLKISHISIRIPFRLQSTYFYKVSSRNSNAITTYWGSFLSFNSENIFSSQLEQNWSLPEYLSLYICNYNLMKSIIVYQVFKPEIWDLSLISYKLLTPYKHIHKLSFQSICFIILLHQFFKRGTYHGVNFFETLGRASKILISHT